MNNKKPELSKDNNSIQEKKSSELKLKPMELIVGDYYTNEQGLLVFTAQYHLRRGFCCGSGCKHCPY